MLTKDLIQDHLKEAMRSGDRTRRETLRLALTAIKLAEVQKGDPLDEAGLLAVLQKECKSRHETIADAERAGRQDLLSSLQEELSVLESYLPEPLSPEEIERRAMETIREIGATDVQEMGKVMKALMPQIQGRADGNTVSQIVRSLLTKG